MQIKNPKFEVSAVGPKQYPKGNLPEIVLVGKSNVGKSSFINTMLNRKNLARTSNTPGKTRQINFYNIESAFNFAIIDCPHLKKIFISNIGIEIPFKTCKYRLGRKSGIVSFVGEKALILWKKRNNNIRFFELIEEDKKKYDLI